MGQARSTLSDTGGWRQRMTSGDGRKPANYSTQNEQISQGKGEHVEWQASRKKRKIAAKSCWQKGENETADLTVMADWCRERSKSEQRHWQRRLKKSSCEHMELSRQAVHSQHSGTLDRRVNWGRVWILLHCNSWSILEQAWTEPSSNSAVHTLSTYSVLLVPAVKLSFFFLFLVPCHGNVCALN